MAGAKIESGLGAARARLEWGGGGQFCKRNSFKMNGSKNPKSEKKSSNQKKKGNPFEKKSENCYQILTPNYPAKSSSWYAIFKNRDLEGDFDFDGVGSPTSPKN